MKSFIRHHPVAAVAAAFVVAAVAGLALAPWWIDLGPVRAKIERAASSTLAGTVAYERMDLSWFPRAEVVVRSVKIAVPGTMQGAAHTVRVSPALLPLLRGRVVLTRIGVEGLDLALDLSAPAKKPPALAPGPDWTQALGSAGAQDLDVAVSGSRMVLSRAGHGALALEGLGLEGTLHSSGGKAALTLTRLSLKSPRLRVEGSLRADAAVPRVELAARGSGLDVTGLREKLLSFAGDDPTVAAIFAIVRGGTLTSFSFASAGKSPDELGALERMAIRAAVTDARVRIEGPDLDLADVSADVALEGGVLSAEKAAARVGKSRAADGKVVIGLAAADDRLQVEAQVKADLAEVPAILGRAIHAKAFRQELALVEGLEGSATGRITIGDRAGDLNTSVSVSELRFFANYRRIPWPLRVDGGEFTFDGTRAGVNRLSGRVGHSTFSGLKARVRLGKTPALEAASGAIDVAFRDFLEGARSIPAADAPLEGVRRLEGSAHIDLRRASGPLARLAEASVDASGTFKEILFSSSSLPTLSIPSGRFAVSDDTVRVSDAAVRSLDASLLVSGAWSGWRGGASTIDASTEGTLGPEAIRWGWERAALPTEFRPAAPIALQEVRFSLARGGALALAGGFTVANGPRLTLDLAGDGKKIEVRNVTVTDGDSTASMALLRPDTAFDVRFKGRLALSTVQKLFAEGQRRPGGIEGEFRTLIPAENPARLTAEGALTATNFEVPTPAGVVTVERLETRAAGGRFDVTSSTLVLDEQRFSAAGSATLRDEAIVLDMDLTTGDLPWTRVEGILGRLEEAKKKETAAVQPASGTQSDGTHSKASSSAGLAIRGDLRVSLDSFAYGSFVARPVLAGVRFDGDAVTAAVRKADICGISTTGTARFLPGGAVAVDVRADSAGPDINVPLTCLGLKTVGMTGSFEASVQAKGDGPFSGLGSAVRGPLTFKAAKGRIGKATLLTRILGVVNATDVFKGKSKTHVGEAMPYDSITVDGELLEGRVSIKAAALKSPAITMVASGTVGYLDRSLDLMVLSHPLSTVDKIVQAIPVVRTILGRDFLAVAVKVTGTLGDPKVTVTPARDVGKGLVGILERTVTLPVTVFDPPSQPAR